MEIGTKLDLFPVKIPFYREDRDTTVPVTQCNELCIVTQRRLELRHDRDCLGPGGGGVWRRRNRRRQAGVHTEGNMPTACRGAGSQSPGSSAGGSREFRSTNRWPTWRTTVPYQVRLLATVPYRARFLWARCAWMCPASRRHCACVLRLKAARERECCLLVLNLVSSTLSCIRQPRLRLRVLDICGFV